MGNLPLLRLEDKARVFGGVSTPIAQLTPPGGAERGVPLYWQEKKPVDWWEDLLVSLDAKMVVDMSPGSGSVGRACLRLNIQYVAACKTEIHRSWLSNVLDREALE